MFSFVTIEKMLFGAFLFAHFKAHFTTFKPFSTLTDFPSGKILNRLIYMAASDAR